MIVTRRISLRKLIGYTWLQLLLLIAFIALSVTLARFIEAELLRALSFATGVLGTALAFLIGFRNNAAYGRWWEAQRAWSKLKHETRSFGLQVRVLVPHAAPGGRMQQKLIHRQLAFAWALNRVLRGQSPGEEVVPLLDEAERGRVLGAVNPPLAILDMQAESIRELSGPGALDSYQTVELLRRLAAFNEVQASCERIKRTPFPMQYSWFMTYSLLVFLLVFPLSLAGHLGYWSIPFSLLIGYAFVMLEYVGRLIENPFENTVNDVPMDYISRSLEIELRQALGEQGLPPPVVPQGQGYLY